MAAADAQVYWMSAKMRTDQFLLYAFDGAPRDVEAAVAEVITRARACSQLRLRVDDSGCPLRYPAWVTGDVQAHRLVVHASGQRDWPGCLDAVARLPDDQLDIRETPWRLHVFTNVRAVPGATGPATVAVVQMGHALGDGIRSAELAGVLFGRATPVGAVPPCRGALSSAAASRPPARTGGWNATPPRASSHRRPNRGRC
jgi:Wax ester synthase-like Acyl-CoA acyltransferase domain